MEQELTKRFSALRAKARSFWHGRAERLRALQAHLAKIRPAEMTPLTGSGAAVSNLDEPSKTAPLSRLKSLWETHRVQLARTLWFPVLFLLGIGLGYSAKTWAENTITIGHEDYRLVKAEKLYELNTLREQALENGAALPVETKPTYPSCSEEMLSDIETAL